MKKLEKMGLDASLTISHKDSRFKSLSELREAESIGKKNSKSKPLEFLFVISER